MLLCSLAGVSSCQLRVEKLKTYGINEQHFVFDASVAVWQDSVFRLYGNGRVVTNAGKLDKGAYEITLCARGTPAYNIYPTINVELDNEVLKEVLLDSGFVTYHIPFRLNSSENAEVAVVFKQDGSDDQGHDRDVLIRYSMVRKP
jgi:hypothetical protein